MRHPAHAIAAAELLAVPMALGLPLVAAVHTVLTAVVIGWRIKVENAVIAQEVWDQAGDSAPGRTFACRRAGPCSVPAAASRFDESPRRRAARQ